MPKVTPDQAAAKWAQNLSAAGPSIQAGVEAVKVSPGQAAARQKAVYLQNVQAAADKWASRVAQVTTADWQQAMVSKAIPRIGTGATAAQPKMSQFLNQLFPHIDRGLATLPARGNLQQNKQRVLAWIDHMAQFKRT
jgi:hypothetical protein